MLDVTNPYTVIDDLSYLRHKGVHFSRGGVSKVDAAAVGTDTVDGPIPAEQSEIGVHIAGGITRNEAALQRARADVPPQ